MSCNQLVVVKQNIKLDTARDENSPLRVADQGNDVTALIAWFDAILFQQRVVSELLRVAMFKALTRDLFFHRRAACADRDLLNQSFLNFRNGCEGY